MKELRKISELQNRLRAYSMSKSDVAKLTMPWAVAYFYSPICGNRIAHRKKWFNNNNNSKNINRYNWTRRWWLRTLHRLTDMLPSDSDFMRYGRTQTLPVTRTMKSEMTTKTRQRQRKQPCPSEATSVKS